MPWFRLECAGRPPIELMGTQHTLGRRDLGPGYSYVSREHTVLSIDDGEVTLLATGSNPTYVRRRRRGSETPRSETAVVTKGTCMCLNVDDEILLDRDCPIVCMRASNLACCRRRRRCAAERCAGGAGARAQVFTLRPALTASPSAAGRVACADATIAAFGGDA